MYSASTKKMKKNKLGGAIFGGARGAAALKNGDKPHGRAQNLIKSVKKSIFYLAAAIDLRGGRAILAVWQEVL